MLGTNWFVHMDEDWMWRWFITDAAGSPLAVSERTFFRRQDAVANLEEARMTTWRL